MKCKSVLLLFGIALFGFDNGCGATPVQVTVKQGVIEGKTVTTRSGFQYDSYQGIPYAKPPLGDLRFRDPQPADDWNGVLDATKPGSLCAQYEPFFTNQVFGSEDCLFLNVYVPKTDVKPLAVMVWIHGGAFVTGDGSPMIFGPDNLVSKNVIMVAMNYRLGPFGFLSLGTEDVPGNAGLKDQTLALKWVQSNIHYFGGCPETVTIFGESAGSASVQYQMLSPTSKGLFSGAIMQSGSCMNPWTLQKHPERRAHELAEILGKGTDVQDIGAFLRTIPMAELALKSATPPLFGAKIRLPFVPSVENDLPGIDAFINRSPEDIMNSGDFHKVPTMSGLTTEEGWVFRTKLLSIESITDAVKENRAVTDLSQFVPDQLKIKYGESTEKIESKLTHHYFPATETVSDGATHLLSDFCFAKDVLSSAIQFAKYSPPTFFYRFSYTGSKNFLSFLAPELVNVSGATHADELGYLFCPDLMGICGIPQTPSDELLSDRLLQMWTDFAKFRNPTPSTTSTIPIIWEPASPSDIVTMDIDRDLKLIPNPFVERNKIWEELSTM